ncbi:MAG: NAD(P)H-dependent oxidoreductase subunit E [Acidobacteria bacterium]|nr:NAD(P)H-dependent oxidoreductase subunit E [Acidobacteriota bacterium]
MSHPLPPDTGELPLAPGQRLLESSRKELSPEALAEIQAIASRYPDRMAATLPALHIAQREFGFVSLAAMKAVAKALGLPEGHVFGVATFYTMYQKKPVGQYHFQVCTNISCALNGAAPLLQKLCARLGVEAGGPPSADGKWSVEEVECLAGCGTAPCVQVNHDVYDEFVDEKMLEEMIAACQRGEYRPWAH